MAGCHVCARCARNASRVAAGPHICVICWSCATEASSHPSLLCVASLPTRWQPVARALEALKPRLQLQEHEHTRTETHTGARACLHKAIWSVYVPEMSALFLPAWKLRRECWSEAKSSEYRYERLSGAPAGSQRNKWTPWRQGQRSRAQIGRRWGLTPTCFNYSAYGDTKRLSTETFLLIMTYYRLIMRQRSLLPEAKPARLSKP